MKFTKYEEIEVAAAPLSASILSAFLVLDVETSNSSDKSRKQERVRVAIMKVARRDARREPSSVQRDKPKSLS